MTDTFLWTKETWEQSVSSRCWWYTPYDAGWDECKEHGADMSADEELRDIVQMELSLGGVPDWATEIVERHIRCLPPCGHCHFPLAFLETISAIGSEAALTFVHTCYTANRERKERAQDYLFCLDAWLVGIGPEEAAKELELRKRPGPDWPTVCRSIWDVLGEQTELKELLVDRTLHRYRWWVKTLTWDDDERDVFVPDTYLGDLRGSGDWYANPGFLDPYFVEKKSPRVKRLEDRIAALTPDCDFFLSFIYDSWLCAPKTFRFLEKTLWAMGKERRYPPDEVVPGFLQCEDTYPSREESVPWWQGFTKALRTWWPGSPAEGAVAHDVNRRLAEPTPVKRWLVRLYLHKLRRLEMNTDDGLAKLVLPEKAVANDEIVSS